MNGRDAGKMVDSRELTRDEEPQTSWIYYSSHTSRIHAFLQLDLQRAIERNDLKSDLLSSTSFIFLCICSFIPLQTPFQSSDHYLIGTAASQTANPMRMQVISGRLHGTRRRDVAMSGLSVSSS